MFKNYRFFKVILLILLIINVLIQPCSADDYSESIEESSQIQEQINEVSASPTVTLSINSRAAVVIDRATNTILYGKNENDKRKMASTTKIMTCLLVLENGNLSDTVQISKKSAGTGGSRLGLKTDDKITVKDLLYGLMLCSGNDTAVALAEYVSGSVEDFAKLMNQKARSLGLQGTSFETPHGLDSENHYTTAYELALLANHALRNETFAKIVGTKSYTVTINGYPKTITNTNELLGNLNGVYGIKTGFTNGANRCLVTACKRNNLDIICVVLGADTKNFRTKDSIKLIEYSFQNYTPVSVQELVDEKFEAWKNENLNKFVVVKGKVKNVELKIKPLKYDTIPINNNEIKDLEVLISCNQNLDAPVLANSSLGKVAVYSGNNLISSTDILLDCNIYRKNLVDYFLEIFSLYARAINQNGQKRPGLK